MSSIAPAADTHAVERRYVFVDHPSVSRFLSKNPLVAAKLAGAIAPIEAVWGTAVRANLEVIEPPDEESVLAVYIQTTDDVDEALMPRTRGD